jgi:hypothetical protein
LTCDFRAKNAKNKIAERRERFESAVCRGIRSKGDTEILSAGQS